MRDYKVGEIVSGHFCINCLQYVNKAEASPENPYKTDWCICCGHRANGLTSTALVGEWFILGKTKAKED